MSDIRCQSLPPTADPLRAMLPTVSFVSWEWEVGLAYSFFQSEIRSQKEGADETQIHS